jgi:O-antigen/teichoic acid export membrane protein
VATLVKVALNAALVPDRGATGSAIAMLVTEALLAFGMLRVLQRRADVAPGARTWSSALLAAAACSALLLLRDPLGGLAAAAVFAVSAALLFGVSGGVPRSDRELLLAALRPRATVRRT